MKRVTENLTGMALAAGLALAAGAGQAAPFRVVSDGPDSVWVLDAGSGALTWCRLRAPSGAKVVDVFGAEGQARPPATHQNVPVCSVARAGAAADPRVTRAVARLGMGTIGGYGYGGGGVAAGIGGSYGLDGSDSQINIVRPGYVHIFVH